MFQAESRIVQGYKFLRQLFSLPLAALGITEHNCRFSPTCSEYCGEAIHKYGLLKGGTKCVGRIVRCRPGVPGGFDPLT